MIGVISDDLTGCGDVGLHFADWGLRTIVRASNLERLSEGLKPDVNWDVLVVNTGSRFDEPRTAYEKVKDVLRFFRKLKIKQIYKKIDSTLRGNIGAEIDALFDELNIKELPFCAAFPRIGRTTIDGYHYVWGELVTSTEFARDPRNPVSEAHIPSLLKRMSKYYSRVKVYDARIQRDLKNIAREIPDYTTVCGASGLAGELVKFWGKSGSSRGVKSKTVTGGSKPILIISGSAKSVTSEQIEVLKGEKGLLAVAIDFERNRVEIPDAKDAKHILIYPQRSSHRLDPEKILRTLVHLTTGLCKAGFFRNLIIIGGDTAFSICRALRIDTFQIISSVSPGIAYCRTLDGKYKFILKPGGLGDKEALIRCVQFFGRSRSS
ncbi:MAG: four-carbon acid sugar kinase family protein [bacterium]